MKKKINFYFYFFIKSNNKKHSFVKCSHFFHINNFKKTREINFNIKYSKLTYYEIHFLLKKLKVSYVC